MIIPITGNVKFPITLDPTVWIFDERKIKFEDAFNENKESIKLKEHSFTSAERYDREVFKATNQNPPISKKDGEEILKNSYVIPLDIFLKTVEINPDATDATLSQTHGGEEILTLEELHNAYLLFAWEGKPLKEDGPVHIYFRDGSNKENPIKYVTKIIIND